MIIDAYATDTVPSHEVRRRANEALTNAGEPMSEVTYDALRKRIAELEAALRFYADKNSWVNSVSLGHPQIDGMTSLVELDKGSKALAALGGVKQ